MLFHSKNRALETGEYALAGALIIAVGATAFKLLGGNIQSAITSIANAIGGG